MQNIMKFMFVLFIFGLFTAQSALARPNCDFNIKITRNVSDKDADANNMVVTYYDKHGNPAASCSANMTETKLSSFAFGSETTWAKCPQSSDQAENAIKVINKSTGEVLCSSPVITLCLSHAIGSKPGQDNIIAKGCRISLKPHSTENVSITINPVLTPAKKKEISHNLLKAHKPPPNPHGKIKFGVNV